METIEAEIDELMRATLSNADMVPDCLKFQAEINGVLCVSSTPEQPVIRVVPPARQRQKRCVHRGSNKCRNRKRKTPSGSGLSSSDSSDNDAGAMQDDQQGGAAEQSIPPDGLHGEVHMRPNDTARGVGYGVGVITRQETGTMCSLE